MPDQPIRLGIIGCGIAARHLHWPALRALRDRFQIVAVCNHTRPKAESLSAEVGGALVFTDHHAMLHSATMEAVLVCLPIHLNRQVAEDCLNAGMHALCEKPLAHTLEMARELVVIVEKSSNVLMVGENYYYRDDFHDGLAAVHAGEIGDVFLIQFQASAAIDHTRSYGATTWRQTPAHRGGFASDAGVHHAAALRLFGGDVARVHAFARNVHPVILAEDNLVASLQFVSGALGSYAVTYTAVQREYRTDLRVFGTAGTLDIGHGELHISGHHGYSKSYAGFDGGFLNQCVHSTKLYATRKASPRRRVLAWRTRS